MSESGNGPLRYAKKSLGQHFLLDPNLQRKIVDALEPTPDDRVVEIGPGTGALTRHIVDRVEHLVAVELDDDLAAELSREYGDAVRVVHGDALEVPWESLTSGEPVKVIGNIPYGITSPLIFHLLEQRPPPTLIVLTVQREVADRLTAAPGTKQYGALTVGVQSAAEVEALFLVSRNAFRPRPEVDSMVVRLTPRTPAPDDQGALRTLTRAAFSRRRKQLQKILRSAPEYGLSSEGALALLAALDIDPKTRPDALPVQDFVRLSRALARPKSPP